MRLSTETFNEIENCDRGTGNLPDIRDLSFSIDSQACRFETHVEFAERANTCTIKFQQLHHTGRGATDQGVAVINQAQRGWTLRDRMFSDNATAADIDQADRLTQLIDR